jgi:hypothetical protein
LKRSAIVAFLAVALAFCWQWGAVHAAYNGNWTALFWAGDRFVRPPEIHQHEYVFHETPGYDGQFYQLIAHDLFLQRGYDAFVDAPRLRYRRILMPALANLFAAGQSGMIDPAYIAVCWLFVALGTFCLAQLAADAGRSVWWGLLFLLTPATLVGIERMTVDISLTALAAAALLAARRQRWLLLWLALASAMLSKETGVLLILAVVFWLMRQRKFSLAAALCSSVLPAIAWYVFVQSHTHGDYSTSGFGFITPFFVLLTLPIDPGIVQVIFRIATLAAVIGMLWAAVRSVVLAVQNHFHDLEMLFSLVFAALLLLFQTDAIWGDPDGFTRIYSPLLVCLIAATWRKGFRQTLAAFGMAAFPLWIQLSVHLFGPILRPYLAR